jgi:hypothetical protein
MSMYYYLVPYAELTQDYFLTTALCPPKLSSHPRYMAMCVNYTAYGQVVYRYLHSVSTIDVESCPNAYNELMALDNLKYGWQLLQEWIWSCSPQINGPFRDFCLQIHAVLPIADERIFTFYYRTQDLAHKIKLAQDTTGMEHKLMHHFFQALCRNGDYCFTRNTLQAFLICIWDMRRSPHHAQSPPPFTYHEILEVIRFSEITRFLTATSLASMNQPLVHAAQMCPHSSPQGHGHCPNWERDHPHPSQERDSRPQI